MKRYLFLSLCSLLFSGLAGCASGIDGVGYYWQSISGHLSLMRAGRPVDEVLEDSTLPQSTRRKLTYAAKAREFASTELGLPDNGSYRRYADIGRSHVVWNVFATEALSLELKRWCFPVAGCIGYRGYYEKQTADKFAQQLAAQGMDVQVAGVPAYSTLGWFDDPIPSTVIRYPEAFIARLIFHELAHQVVYVKNNSTFNESFATAVEIEGMKRWFRWRQRTGEPPAEQAQYEQAASRKRDFVALLRNSRLALETLYASDVTVVDKQRGKAQIFADLQSSYQRLKEHIWLGYSGYDKWFDQPLGNAHLAAVGAYHDLVPAFSQLLADSGNQMDKFYQSVQQLGNEAVGERDRQLKALSMRANAAK
ncbi:MAG: aminopeptidase [Burkholderiaceae bacterium]